MRILLFSTAYLPFVGGAELAVKEITDRLPGIEFDLITAKLKRGLADFEKIGNVNIHRIGAGNIFDKPLLPNLGFLKALKFHKKKKYDLIHGIMASQGSAAAYLFKFFNKKIPFVLTLQEGDLDRNSSLDRFWQRRIVKKADVITAISSYLSGFARKFNKKAPVFVVPNGVDLQKFSTYGGSAVGGKSKSEKVKTDEEKTIITVSRLVRKNGIDILIKAVSHLTSRISLLIVGDGKERKKLEKLAKKLGIENRIRFLGNLPHGEIPKYLSQTNIFVRPSRSEGLGSAFLEAMALGLPVIGSSAGGIPDFLKDGETGLICEKENSEDLAEKIKILLEDENLRLKLARNGRKLVEEKYNWDTIAGRMRDIYHEIINRHSGI